ncbi:Os02g0215950 [Oryza sativa Japonica Group]|nr:Os02g0215950 [Oryza sativa Japonica Group]|eukprot:NP_001172859.1 Os02g0215950 [Oryza sativa Japonica Group]
MVGASAIVSAPRTPHAPPPRGIYRARIAIFPLPFWVFVLARQGGRLITPPRSPESGGRRLRRPPSPPSVSTGRLGGDSPPPPPLSPPPLSSKG